VSRRLLDRAPLPKRPYRDSVLVNLALALVILIVARLTDGDFGRAIGFAIAYFVFATAWNWWRFRQRLQRQDRP
jgi:hypothetical protein